MNRKILYPFLATLLLTSIIQFSCQKELSSAGGTQTGTGQTVTASVTGRVVDENKIPVSGAQVSTQNGTASTDVNGVFRLVNVKLDKDAGYVKIEKSGYFTGSRTFTVNTAGNNYVEVELIPKVVAGTFTAATGGPVTVPSGGTISFPANAVMNTSTKAIYNGSVSVAAFHITPGTLNFTSIMPGTLEGISTGNQQVSLRSYGMMAVELSGAGGEKLQLAGGKTATITFPIPSFQQAKAPQSIPLWYFDETKGLWKEEGSATRQGNNYVGSVTHFSYWNCDEPFPLVGFEAIIHDENGNPMPYTRVDIRLAGDTTEISRSGYTDSAGKVMGKVPAKTELALVVYNQCKEPVYYKSIGSLGSNTNIGTLTVKDPGAVRYTFSGTMVNCTGTAVANGLVNINMNGYYFRAPVRNGTFSTTITTCSSAGQATITGYDITTNKATDTVVTSTSGGTNIQLKACGSTISQFINFTLNGTSYMFTPPADSVTGYRDLAINYVEAFDINSRSAKNFYFKFTGAAAPGAHNVYTLRFTLGNSSYMLQDSVSANITEYGNPSEYMAGGFSGVVKKDSTTSTYPFNCTFKVRRIR